MAFIKNGLLFREVEPGDLALLRQWRNDPKMSTYWNSPQSVQTDLEQLRWYNTLCAQKQAFVVIDYGKDENVVIGMLRFVLDQERKAAALTGTDVAPNYQGKEYGKRILKAGAEYVIKDLGYHRVTAEAMEGHVAAHHIIVAAGFKQEGVWRDYVWRDGKWNNWHVYSLLAGEL